MRVDMRYFAIVRETIGQASEQREVAEGTTTGQLFDTLIAEFPRLERMRPLTMMMVNRGYVRDDHPLQDGDEVALIPPVSGGESAGKFRIQSGPIDAREVEALVANPGAGAIATFSGVVRDHGRGRAVARLEYEAYPAAAELVLAQIGDEIRERWQTDHVAIVHRVGDLPVGETSVVISVASAHRDAAFEACRYAIERIKEIVPIWKKEHYEGGAVWIGSEQEYQVEIGRFSDAAE